MPNPRRNGQTAKQPGGKTPLLRDLGVDEFAMLSKCLTQIRMPNQSQPIPMKEYNKAIYWLGLAASLAIALFYSLWALKLSLAHPFVIQDDARQHVFWMQRFLDPALFPNDPIADYFQSVAPWGYAQLYHLAATLGIHPILMSKLVPSALGLVMTYFCYGLALELMPLTSGGALTGVIASWLLNQNLWLQDGIVSGTPKAFLYPTLLAFLYFFLRRSLWPCFILLLLQALFYPLGVFLSSGVMALACLRLEGWKPRWVSAADLRFCGVGIGVAIAVLLPYVFSSSAFGPVIDAAQARALPEFQMGGRSAFFNDANPWDFWLNGGRSSLRISAALRPDGTYAAFLLPILLRFKKLPGVQALKNLSFFPQLFFASLGWFFLAHLTLFKLHLPSRYSQHSLRILVVLAAAIALTLMLQALQTWLGNVLRTVRGRQALKLISTGLLLLWLFLVPLGDRKFPRTYNAQGNYPELYAFLQNQPATTRIASLSAEANNLPSFAQRSIIAGSEYAIPYHWGYYGAFRERAIAMLEAQYSPNLDAVQSFIRQQNVDYWLLDDQSFNAEVIEGDRWLKAFQPQQLAAVSQLRTGSSALQQAQQSCLIFETQNLRLLDAKCLLNKSVEPKP